MSEQPQSAKVLEGISEVMADLAEVGIGKNKENRDQNFKYRGIDDVYNVLASLLSKHKIVIVPRVKDRVVDVRQTSRGSNWYYVTLFVEYDIYSAIDGSKILASAFGEAADSADKATNKAMSVAYKYLCFQLFCIPVDVQDADATTPPETVSPEAKGFSVPADKKHKQSKQQQQPPKDTQQNSFNLELTADIEHRADEAEDEEQLATVAGDLFKAVRASQIPLDRAKTVALLVTSKRSGVVDVEQLDSLRKMVTAFSSFNLLTPSEADVAISTAEARLNQ